MKGVTAVVKNIAIVLNVLFLAFLLFTVKSKGVVFGQADFREWAGLILTFTFPPVTLVALAFDFLKKKPAISFYLKVISIIINFSYLITIIFEVVRGRFGYVVFNILMLVLLAGLPIVNLLAILPTFQKCRADMIQKPAL
jgi:hypothetical protein